MLVLALLLPFTCFSQKGQQYIDIGLLLPDNSYSDIIPAAELAIREANLNDGLGNQEFRLHVRTAEGFWGAGSKESVNLVYEDQVRAIVGSLDGRNGHLAEQVATKSHLSYIETFATDPTLSQAFVPWFMRVVPNDDQQAMVLVDQIRKEGGTRVILLSTGTYDCKYAVRSLSKALAREAGISPMVIKLEPGQTDYSGMAEKIIQYDPDHLLIPFDAPFLKILLEKLEDDKPELKVYGTLHFSLGVEKRKEEWQLYEGMYVLGPLLKDKGPGKVDSSQAAFLYDAINLVINAIRQVGTERQAISDYISGTSYPEGASGSISFDDLGNRTNAAKLYQIINGNPQSIN